MSRSRDNLNSFGQGVLGPPQILIRYTEQVSLAYTQEKIVAMLLNLNNWIYLKTGFYVVVM